MRVMGAGANSLGGGAIDLLGSSLFLADLTTPYVVAEYRPGAGGVFLSHVPHPAGWMAGILCYRALAKRRSRADFADLLRALR